MKNFYTLIFVLFLSASLFANGVIIPDSASIKYLPLVSSTVDVSVDGQVAITKTTQVFKNTTEDSMKIQYAFPMPVEASALSLMYRINGHWYAAKFSATEQDSISGGGGTTIDYELLTYLGENPLKSQSLQAGEEIRGTVLFNIPEGIGGLKITYGITAARGPRRPTYAEWGIE